MSEDTMVQGKICIAQKAIMMEAQIIEMEDKVPATATHQLDNDTLERHPSQCYTTLELTHQMVRSNHMRPSRLLLEAEAATTSQQATRPIRAAKTVRSTARRPPTRMRTATMATTGFICSSHQCAHTTLPMATEDPVQTCL